MYIYISGTYTYIDRYRLVYLEQCQKIWCWMQTTRTRSWFERGSIWLRPVHSNLSICRFVDFSPSLSLALSLSHSLDNTWALRGWVDCNVQLSSDIVRYYAILWRTGWLTDIKPFANSIRIISLAQCKISPSHTSLLSSALLSVDLSACAIHETEIESLETRPAKNARKIRKANLVWNLWKARKMKESDWRQLQQLVNLKFIKLYTP